MEAKMRIAKIIALIGVVAMAGIIIYAFAVGNFSEEGSVLLSMPWGIVSLVDLYTGFTLFSAWIVYREKSVLRSVVWVFFMMTLGFFTASLYTFIALQTSKGDWQRFWMGKRAPGK
jgi:predicted small integral membrane protein